MRIFGLEIRKPRRKKPLTGAAATAHALKLAGQNGRVPGAGRKKGPKVRLTVLERRQLQAKTLEAETKHEMALLELQIKRDELLSRQRQTAIDPLEQTVKTLESVDRLVELVDRRRSEPPEEDNSLRGIGREALREVGHGFAAGLAALVKTAKEQSDTAQQAGLAPLQLPAPATIQQAPEASMPASQAPNQEAQEQQLIAELDSRTPQEAAQWLLAQAAQNPDVAGFVRTLINTPDDSLPALLTMIGFRSPRVAAYVRSNWDKFLLTVQALRFYNQNGAGIQQPTDKTDLGL